MGSFHSLFVVSHTEVSRPWKTVCITLTMHKVAQEHAAVNLAWSHSTGFHQLGSCDTVSLHGLVEKLQDPVVVEPPSSAVCVGSEGVPERAGNTHKHERPGELLCKLIEQLHEAQPKDLECLVVWLCLQEDPLSSSWGIVALQELLRSQMLLLGKGCSSHQACLHCYLSCRCCRCSMA